MQSFTRGALDVFQCLKNRFRNLTKSELQHDDLSSISLNKLHQVNMCDVEEQKQVLVSQIFDLFFEKSPDKTSKMTFWVNFKDFCYHVGWLLRTS